MFVIFTGKSGGKKVFFCPFGYPYDQSERHGANSRVHNASVMFIWLWNAVCGFLWAADFFFQVSFFF